MAYVFRPRIIPVLLLKNNGLVKSIHFRDYRYIGDPINAVNLFNNLYADELYFFDIVATSEKRTIDLHLLKRIADEANMPFGVGGGIRNIDTIRDVLKVGAERIVISTKAVEQPEFIKTASAEFGSSTIAVCIDVKKNFLGKHKLCVRNGAKTVITEIVDFARMMEDYGAGEIIVNSIDNDGLMNGYDIPIIKNISQAVTIPVVALGGAGSRDDFRKVIDTGYASAAAAGSFFIYKGKRKAVLINYPETATLDSLFENVCKEEKE